MLLYRALNDEDGSTAPVGTGWPTFLTWADRYIKAPRHPNPDLAPERQESREKFFPENYRKHLTRVYLRLYYEYRVLKNPSGWGPPKGSPNGCSIRPGWSS